MYFYNNSSDVRLLGNLLRKGMGRRRIACADLLVLTCCPVYSPYISPKSWFGKCALLGLTVLLCAPIRRWTFSLRLRLRVLEIYTLYTGGCSVGKSGLAFVSESITYVCDCYWRYLQYFSGDRLDIFFFLFCVCCKGLFTFIEL